MSSLPLGSRIGALLGRMGLKGRVLVIAIPTVWLLIFFLIPFLVVAKISFSVAAIARPPYLPIVEWVDGFFRISLNFGNYLFLLEDPLYVAAYLGSVKIAGVSTLIALLIGYPMAYLIARSEPDRRNLLLMLVFIPAVGEFVIPALLGGPDTLMIGQVLWNEFFSNRDWPIASAVAIVMLFVLVIPVMLLRWAQSASEGENQ